MWQNYSFIKINANRKTKVLPSVSEIFKIYPNLHFIDKLHILGRVVTCPWEAILADFPTGRRLIDIGCGHGLFINLLDINFKGYERLTGIDISDEKIKIAKKTENNRVSFYRSALPDFPEVADVYSFFDVLYLMPYKEQEYLIEQIYNLLPQNGYLVIKDLGKKPLYKYLMTYIEEFIMVKILKRTSGTGLYFRSAESFRLLLGKIGFDVKSFDISKHFLYPHIYFICQKKVKKS